MARIKWVNHKECSYLNGTIAHVSQFEANYRIDITKEAERAPAPRYGSREYLEDRQAEQAAAIQPLPPAVVSFAVGIGPIDGALSINATCTRGCRARYTGDPDAALRVREACGNYTKRGIEHLLFTHSCGTSPETFPPDVCAQYRKAKQAENPKQTLSVSEATYHALAAPQTSKPSAYPPMPVEMTKNWLRDVLSGKK
jgi:hypothetical protein